jgi:hypothetical protein
MSVQYSFILGHPGDYLPVPGRLLLDAVQFQTGHDATTSRVPRASAEMGTRFVSRSDLALIVSRGLDRIYRDARHARKLLARAIGVESETARSYLNGKRLPSAWNLLQLMANNRSLRSDIDRLIDDLEMARSDAIHNSGKNKQLSNCRRADAQLRVGMVAQTRLGCGQDGCHDRCWMRSRVVLVDVTPFIG